MSQKHDTSLILSWKVARRKASVTSRLATKIGRRKTHAFRFAALTSIPCGILRQFLRLLYVPGSSTFRKQGVDHALSRATDMLCLSYGQFLGSDSKAMHVYIYIYIMFTYHIYIYIYIHVYTHNSPVYIYIYIYIYTLEYK